MPLIAAPSVSVSDFLWTVPSFLKEMTNIRKSDHLSCFRVFKVLSHVRTHLILKVPNWETGVITSKMVGKTLP